VGECFFWYQPTQVVLDKGPLNGCVNVKAKKSDTFQKLTSNDDKGSLEDMFSRYGLNVVQVCELRLMLSMEFQTTGAEIGKARSLKASNIQGTVSPNKNTESNKGKYQDASL